MALLTYDTRRHSPQFLRTTNLTHARNPLTPSVTRCDALGLQLHLACAFFLHDTSYFFPPHCAMPVPTPMNLAAHIQDFTTEAVHLCPLHLGSTFPGPLRRTRRHSGKMASSEDRLYRLPCRKCVRYCLSSPSLTLLRQFLNNFRHSSYARHASLTAVLAYRFRPCPCPYLWLCPALELCDSKCAETCDLHHRLTTSARDLRCSSTSTLLRSLPTHLESLDRPHSHPPNSSPLPRSSLMPKRSVPSSRTALKAYLMPVQRCRRPPVPLHCSSSGSALTQPHAAASSYAAIPYH